MAPHPTAASVRFEIEGALVRKIPAALTPQLRVARERVSTGVAEVDALLEGGLPVGAISELTGPMCAGRTTLALAYVAGLMRQGQVCAWVDATDGFDPESAMASGVEAERLLWVRCGREQAQAAAPVGTAGTRYGVASPVMPATACGGPHPRGEERGLSNAIGELLEQASGWKARRMTGKPGTPSAVNLSLPGAQPAGRVEQVAWDRLPARRGEASLALKAKNIGLAGLAEELAEAAPLSAETQQGFARKKQAGVIALPGGVAPATAMPRPANRPWDRLDQAIRATDLLLQGGGFGCVVLDLSGVDAEFSSRIPLATWFRFRMAADKARTSLLLLTRHPCAHSSAEVVLQVSAEAPAPCTVMSALPLVVASAKQRFKGMPNNVVSIRKPPQPERNIHQASWTACTHAAARAGGRR